MIFGQGYGNGECTGGCGKKVSTRSGKCKDCRAKDAKCHKCRTPLSSNIYAKKQYCSKCRHENDWKIKLSREAVAII